MKDRTTTQPQKKQRFLEALQRTYSVLHSAEAAKISRRQVYDWRAKDADFAQAWDQALERCVEALEQAMYERAMKIRTHPKDKGAVTLAIFLAKSMKPEKYKERASMEHSGTVTLEQLVAGSKPPSAP